ncbi:uncharacterized protein LOC124880102 isoform X2 [Girardinichthys multiradiatus]|uniref:uncharacterized protein LOC124880102 isoform X2 n=1 Tax=Girardinichthys multiradiatus TaxID=208333 RepID=UPI001FAD2161|nr:uncharacterized protein LOC124880102 isoform X2 [Girardinichthys multiradiatus]
MGNSLLRVQGLLCLSSLVCCEHTEDKPELVLIVSPSWLSPGASVTLRCEVKPPSAGWAFYWYKAVPDISQRNYRYELLPDSIRGTVEDFYIIHGQRNTAGYACRAGRGNQEYLTDYSEQKIVWSQDSQPATSLRVSPNREKHFTSDNVQLYCEGKSASWRVKRFTNSWSDSTDCSDWGTLSESSCTINSSWSHLSVYWCESGSGEFSNAVNITIHAPKPLLTVSPSWLSPGASVTLICEVEHPSAEWRFYWYKAVPDPSYLNYKFKLLPGSREGTVNDTYVIRGTTHTVGYACRTERRNPEYPTDYSEPKYVWSAGSYPTVSFTVSPDREQHSPSVSVTLSCGTNSAEWRVMKFSEKGYIANIENCPGLWTTTGSSCTFSTHLRHQSGVYWCESGSGEFSNAVNISVHNRDLLLVSPVHPVTEGTSVILICKQRGENTLSNVIFYNNEKLVQNDSRGELNISAVSQSDEGFYKCEHSGKVSPQSWMAVQAASRPESSLFIVLLVTGSVGGVILIIFLLLLCHFRQSKEQPVSKDQHQDQQQIYSSLLHGDLCVYETIRGSANSGKGQHDDSENFPDSVGMTSS